MPRRSCHGKSWRNVLSGDGNFPLPKPRTGGILATTFIRAAFAYSPTGGSPWLTCAGIDGWLRVLRPLSERSAGRVLLVRMLLSIGRASLWILSVERPHHFGRDRMASSISRLSRPPSSTLSSLL